MNVATQSPQLPKVSVIIAVYNNSEYLMGAVNSALSQDFPNLDVWVCDDCSNEALPIGNEPPDANWITCSLPERQNEVEKCRCYNINGRQLYYLRLAKNGGPSRARNIAIANAMRNGSHLFLILDSDDIAYPTKVSTLIQPILKDPQRVAVTYGDYLIEGENGVARYESKPCFDWMRLFNGDCHIHSGSLISGAALKDFYPVFYPEDQRVAEDLSLWFKILKRNWLAYHIGSILTLVRSHKNDSTNSVNKEQWSRDYQKAMSYRKEINV